MTNVIIKKATETAPLAATLIIEDDKGLKKATELLSTLNRHLDALTEDKEKITKPLNASLKEIRAKYRPAEDLLESAIASIRDKMSRYQTALVNKAREEEAKIAARVGEGKGKLKIETALAKLESIEKPLDMVATAEGSVKFRATPRLKITNQSAIPDTYWIVDEAALFEALKGGLEVPGACIEIIQTVVNSR